MNRILNIFWFRKDLRIKDNKALKYFIEGQNPEDKFCIVYIKNPDTYNFYGEKRVTFLLESLIELKTELKKFKLNLQILYGKSDKVFAKISEFYSPVNIYCNAQIEPYSLKRDDLVKNILKSVGGSFNVYADTTIFDFNRIKTATCKPYTIFTPFRKKLLALINDNSCKSIEVNPGKLNKKSEIKLDFVDKYNPENDHNKYNSVNLIEGGRNKAIKKLKEFTKQKLMKYHHDRDYPAKPSTSLLSPHIHFGTISIRECFREAFKITGDFNTCWINELIWREFYYNITYHFPYIIKKSFKEKYDSLTWDNNENKFKKWKEGLTGYPIVDAGMRQLNQEGWMHNRVRMITAMFLVKDLLIDWRWGENYFAENLTDLDFSLNNGGWQWSASTGCDAQPYFRIFNPELQSRKYDPEGIYIKKYLPELGNVKSKHIHNPSAMNKSEQISSNCIIGKNYPQPIVSHSKAKEEAISRFKNITNKFTNK